MARYAAINGIMQPEQLKRFDMENYQFDANGSDEHRWVFRRKIT